MNPRDLTAWLDDEASPRQERAVRKRMGAEAETARARWRAVRSLLREHLQPPPLPHPDFVNARVAAEIPRAARTPAPRSLRGWIWAGSGSLAAAALLTLALLPGALRPADQQAFTTQVLSARSADGRVSVTAFRAPRERGVVLWVEGAGFIRPEETVR